jgi:hypothetical protein
MNQSGRTTVITAGNDDVALDAIADGCRRR